MSTPLVVSGAGVVTSDLLGDGARGRPAMERTLGKLVMDARFRDAFFHDPVEASRAAEIDLTAREVDALARIRPGALAAFRRYLDMKWTSGVTEDVTI